MADRGGNECAIFARSAAVQTGEGLDGLHSIEPFVDIHGVEERLIEACLIFLRDDEHLMLLGGEFLGEFGFANAAVQSDLGELLLGNVGIDDFAGEGDKSLDVRISLLSDVFL